MFTEKDYDLSIVSHTEPNDISIFSRPDYYFDYKSDAFNQIIADLSVTADPAKRSELLKAAQTQLANERAEIEDYIDNYKVYPILQIGLGYRF